jgi:hypothetical protein
MPLKTRRQKRSLGLSSVCVVRLCARATDQYAPRWRSFQCSHALSSRDSCWSCGPPAPKTHAVFVDTPQPHRQPLWPPFPHRWSGSATPPFRADVSAPQPHNVRHRTALKVGETAATASILSMEYLWPPLGSAIGRRGALHAPARAGAPPPRASACAGRARGAGTARPAPGRPWPGVSILNSAIRTGVT